MQAFMLYILQVNLLLILFYAGYWLLLKKEKFFTLNRVILFGVLLVSIIIPLLPSLNTGYSSLIPKQVFSPFISGNSSEISSQTTSGVGGLQSSKSVLWWTSKQFWWQVLIAVYFVGVFFMLLRFIKQVLKVYYVLQQTNPLVLKDIPCRVHELNIPPFSFFRYLCINPSAISPPVLDQVLMHEKTHIRHHHSIDILLAEIVQIGCWFNPFFIILKRSIRLNLEYIADDSVLRSGTAKRTYQYTLLNNTIGHSRLILPNLFYSSTLKLRIKMMNTMNTPQHRLYRYLFLVPIILAGYFLANPVIARETENVRIEQNLEGYYRSEKDGKSLLHVFALQNRLVAKQLWDNKEILLEQQADLDYATTDQTFTIKFSKNNKGIITGLVAYNSDKWTRVQNYTPEERKAVPLNAAQLSKYEGTYKRMSLIPTYI